MIALLFSQVLAVSVAVVLMKVAGVVAVGRKGRQKKLNKSAPSKDKRWKAWVAERRTLLWRKRCTIERRSGSCGESGKKIR